MKKINVDRIKEGALEPFQEFLDAKELDLEFVDFHYLSKINVEGNLEKILHTLTFHGSIKREIEHICARCLKSVEEKIHESVHLTYETKDVEEIDMTDDIRDTLLLSRPERFLCDVNCKGLCSNCGVDLNTESCRCEKTTDLHPFLSLKKWKKQEEGDK